MEEHETLSEALRPTLERVPALRTMFEAIKLGTPLLGSCEAADRTRRFGELPSSIARQKLSVALDHVTTWQRYLLVAGWMPAYAHLTLLRPVFEASVCRVIERVPSGPNRAANRPSARSNDPTRVSRLRRGRLERADRMTRDRESGTGAEVFEGYSWLLGR